jgi:hypothetical protein
MSEKRSSSGKNGGNQGRNTNPSGKRGGDRMANSSKTMASNLSDDHMGRRRKLREDAESGNLEHTNRVREKKGLPSKESTAPSPDESKALEEGEDELGLGSGELIVALRKYSRLDSGMPVGQSCGEDDFVAAHRKVRRERATYRELDKRMATYGKVYAERKGGYLEKENRKVTGRKGTCPLRTIMVRLMPHEGAIVGERMSDKSLQRAIDRAASEFARATGAEIVTAAVHRMGEHDLHLHLQYTMVQLEPEPPKTYGKRFNAWEEAGKAMARAELKAEGLSLHPRRVGARRMKLIEKGIIEPAPPRLTEWRKRKSGRSLEDKSILGYKFRNKVNLVRAAEAVGDTELAERVAVKKDEVGRFRELLKNSDEHLVRKYLDLWFERVWRQSVYGQLTRDARKQIRHDGFESARDYLVLDTTVVETIHVERTKTALKEKSDELEKAQKDLEQDQVTLTAERREQLETLRKKQQEIDDARQRLESREKKLVEREENERIRLKDIGDREKTVADAKVASATDKKALDQRIVEVNKKESGLPTLEAAAELQGVQAAFETLFPGRKAVSVTSAGVLGEIKTGIETVRDNTVAMAEDEVARQLDEIREMTEPVAVTAVAAKLRFAPEYGGEDGALTREVKAIQTDKPSFWQRLVTTGQKFVLSIVGNANVSPRKGSGAIQLIQAVNPKASLDEVVGKLVEWFPKKRHAIMTELVDRHGSELMRSLIRSEAKAEKPKDGPKLE